MNNIMTLAEIEAFNEQAVDLRHALTVMYLNEMYEVYKHITIMLPMMSGHDVHLLYDTACIIKEVRDRVIAGVWK